MSDGTPVGEAPATGGVTEEIAAEPVISETVPVDPVEISEIEVEIWTSA